ncbi:hypothetical protein BC832DRAFT_559158 [Gaertneriomyces semiglobifer]|nr:hypothetical protein BC832DRAFT_559158 [Gaertneriomyces semiglobifer]
MCLGLFFPRVASTPEVLPATPVLIVSLVLDTQLPSGSSPRAVTSSPFNQPILNPADTPAMQ